MTIRTLWTRVHSVLLTFVMVATLLAAPPPEIARAAVFTVNSIDDVDDGTCDVTHCSLREAITAANANAGPDVIGFNILGSGPHTITLTSSLPTVTSPVTIDGWSQSGSVPNTINAPGPLDGILQVVIDFSLAASGLTLSGGSDGSTVQGLVLNGLPGPVLVASGSADHVIVGNYIGTDVTGAADAGGEGIQINNSPGTRVGGAFASERNLISGSSGSAVTINAGSVGAVIQGNVVGMNSTLTAAIPNADGLSIRANGVSASSNVVAGNSDRGIEMQNANTATLTLNSIGLPGFGNGGWGVVVQQDSGGAQITGNRITANGSGGILVSGQPTVSADIYDNSIFDNTGLGIDLDPAGAVLPNDPQDVDSGANGLQNYPTLSSATDGATISVDGFLNSLPTTDFDLDFYASASCDPSGNGEGETFIERISVATDANGDALGTWVLEAGPPVGSWITATATGPDGTSEFSECVVLAGSSATPLQDLINGNPGGVVVVPPGTYAETITIGGGTTLRGGGAGPADVVIDAGGADSAVTVTSGDVTFENLTIDGGASPEYGGGIYIPGQPHTVTLINVQVVGNDAALNGGGIWMDESTLGNQNTLILTDSVISANIANGDGGGVYLGTDSILEVTNTTFENNLAGDGGGIYTNGTATVSGGLFTNNDAEVGGGIYQHWSATSLTINAPTACTVAPDVASFVPLTTFVGNDASGGTFSDGGAIYNSAVASIYDTLFSDNSAVNGGAIYEDSGGGLLTVRCSAFELNDASNDGGAIGGNDDGAILVEDTLFAGNAAGGNGGAIGPEYDGNPTEVRRSIFAANTASAGGALYAQDDLILEDSELSGNAAELEGGALFGDGATIAISDSTISGNVAAEGAGIATSGGTLTVADSDISNNQAVSGLFWDFENPVTAGAVSSFNATIEGGAASVVSGIASQTGAGPVELLPEANDPQFAPPAGLVHITRFITDGSDGAGSHYPYIEFTNSAPISLERLTFEHFHNHNSTYPTFPDYRVQLQLSTDGGAYVDIGGSVFIAPSTFGDVDDVSLESTLLAPGTHRIRWTARNLAFGTDTNTEYLALNDVRLSFVSGLGGGIRADSTTVAISGSTLDGNVATKGGAIHSSGFGGTLDVGRTTVSNNTALSNDFNASGGVYDSAGGSMVNSTISGNRAPFGGTGAVYSGSNIDLNHVTITDNYGRIGTGGLSTGESSFHMANSIVAGNTSVTGTPDCSAFIISGGGNVVGIDDVGCADGWLGSDQVGDSDPIDLNGPIDPLLGPLADNGGPTLTHLPQEGSPAIDSAGNTVREDSFTASSPIQLNGAAVTTLGNIKLTDTFGQRGSAFRQKPISPNQDFEMEFSFRISDLEMTGGAVGVEDSADGLTFAIVADPTTLGGGGGSLGIGDIANAVSVEFDTFNGTLTGFPSVDINGNHLGINVGDTVDSSLLQAAVPVSMDDGDVWNAVVSYDASTDLLTAAVSKSGLAPTVLSTTVDLASVVDADQVFVGFTAATGAGRADHYVLSGVLKTASALEIANIPDASFTFPVTSGAATGTNDAAVVGQELVLLPADSLFGNGTSWASTAASSAFDLTKGFSTRFDFTLSDLVQWAGSGEPSGDGFTFAIAPNLTTFGEYGGRLGVGKSLPGGSGALSIEFDTFANSGVDPVDPGVDFGDHIGINLDSVGNGDGMISDATALVGGNLDDGGTWTAWIDYRTDTDLLEVRLASDGIRPASPSLALEVDLAAEVGSTTGYFGFTAGSGLAHARVAISNWSLSTTDCPAADQRGVLRPIGPSCDTGSVESADGAVLPDVDLTMTAPSTVEPGALEVPVSNLPSSLASQPTDAADPKDDNVASAPIAGLDTQSSPIESSPIAGLPIAGLDVSGAPIAGLPIAGLPIAGLSAAAQQVLNEILLSDIPLTGGWEPHLAASPNLANRPVQSVTYGEAMQDLDVLTSLGEAGLTFNDMNVASTPIAGLPIAGLALGNLPIAGLPIAGLSASVQENLEAWCGVLDGQEVNCTTLGITPSAGSDLGLLDVTISGGDISSAPIAGLPIAGLDTATAPIAGLPIAGLPIAGLVLTDSPIAGLPIAGLPIAGLPIAGLPIAGLDAAGTPIAGLPIAGLPIAGLPIAGLPIAGLAPAGAPIAGLYLEGAPIAGLPIAGLPIAGLPIAGLPIAGLPIAGLIDCSGAFDCSAIGATVGDAFEANALLGSVEDWALLLTIADLLTLGVTNAPPPDGDGLLLTESDFFDVFFEDGTLLGDLVDGGFPITGQTTLAELADYLGMTLGELLEAMIAGGLGNDYFLGDIMLLLVNPGDYPWEDLDLGTLQLQLFATEGGTATYSSAITLTNGAGLPGTLTLTLPEGFVFLSSTVDGQADNHSAVEAGQQVIIFVPSMNDETTDIDVIAGASLSLGIKPASATINVGGVTSFDVVVTTVVEAGEDVNNATSSAAPVAEDTVYVTHVGTEDDVDLFKVEGVQQGDRLSVILSDMTEDFDLVLYGPELPLLRGTPDSIATGVSDPGSFVDGNDELQAENAGDVQILSIPGYVPIATSTQRDTSDELITTNQLPIGGDYFFQISGYNGVTSTDPGLARVEVIERPTSFGCSPKVFPFDGEGVAGTDYTAGPGPYNTLVLFNQERYGDTYGAQAAADVRSALEGLVGQNALGVNGIVASIDADTDVQTAYGVWDGDRCNPLAANGVVNAVGALVDDYRATHPTLEYVVIVGADDQIPFARVQDHTQLSNEREYTYSISTDNNELAGSLSTGFILTDDPYGDPNPTLVEGKRLLYVSEIAMGRLVESTSEILTAIGNFSTFNGRLDPATTSSAFGTGYDFIEDAAEAIDLALETDPRRVAPGGSSTTLNTVGGSGNLWSSDDLTAAILGADLDLVSLGAHMAHDGLLSALEDFSNTQADLWDTNDAAALASDFEGTIIFSMGCHSGLSVSDVQIGSPRPDFASTFSAAGAVYLAETGFGYGETEVVALGEELMRQFALRLNGSMTVGQADLYASQFHAAQNSSFGAYDEKVIMETTLYGLPFYAVGNATATPAPPPPKATTTDPSTGLTVVSTSIDTVNDGVVNNTGFDRITGQRGDFFTANGKVQVLPFQPIQPKATVDVTQPGLTATDVLITELTSTDIANFPASFARPIVDSTDKEPEISLTGTFPLILPGVNRYLDITGTRTNLVTVLGQYTSGATAGIGTERLFTHVQAQVHYIDSSVSKANRDLARPVVLSANAVDNGTVLNFTAKAVDDASEITRVLVLYKAVNTNGAWTPLNLVKTAPGGPGAASSWSASVLSLGGDVEYVVQAVDESGRVGVHYNKRAGHQSVQTPLPPPPPPGITIVDDATGDPVPTISVNDVTVRINGITGTDIVLYKVDEGPITPYTGPVTVTGDRLHRFTAYINGQETFVEFLIDTTAPDILIASPVDGTLVNTGTALVADFTCSDAGVGVDTCAASVAGPAAFNPEDGDTIGTAITGTYTMTVDSTDEEGNESSASVTYEVVDPLTLTVTPLLVPLGDEITATVGFTPSVDHPHTATWTLGDGTVVSCPGATSCLSESTGTSTITHTYAQTGVYLVTVVVDHDGFGTQTKQSQFIVVYDATGGFVTGGGWFTTPFGAFTPENSLDAEVTGRAEFGFVSKYKKGSIVPTGNTVFELVTSGFEFHSTSYDWLVVQGAKAAYKGTGTIDGWSGTYKFRITIRDADINDNDQFVDDAFRIQIWQDRQDETQWIVYDNAFGTNPDSEFGGTQPIDGGSIVIHVPKGKK